MTERSARLATSAGTLILVEEAARTGSGDSGPITSLGAVRALKAQLHVTEVSGAGSEPDFNFPSLTVVVEETLDGTNWNQIGAFARKTSAGIETISLGDRPPLAETIRFRWTITGDVAPLFRFSVTSPACWSDA